MTGNKKVGIIRRVVNKAICERWKAKAPRLHYTRRF